MRSLISSSGFHAVSASTITRQGGGRKDGRILSISLTVSPIRDLFGVIVGASKIARDISEQVQFEQALQEANESLTRANADLEQFAYSASHDLQEPLRMISTYSEMLQRKFSGELGPSGDHIFVYIVTGVTRMEQLLKDLRAFIQASTGGERSGARCGCRRSPAARTASLKARD